MIKIYKASAGAGKTYNLTKNYVETVLKDGDADAYRHILAVTFTNKATAEMKARILKRLAETAKTDPNARKLLVNLLHDYGAFAVSTIDKFFQRALRSFAREIGQSADYQIELDRESLIVEAMDRLLDSMTSKDADLLDWFLDQMGEKLNDGKKFDFDDSLYTMCKLLKNVEHQHFVETLGIDENKEYGKARIGAIKAECSRIIEGFHKSVHNAARAVDKSKLSVKCQGWLEKYETEIKPNVEMPAPQATLLKACPDSDFAQLFQSEAYAAYNTARTLQKLLYTMGLAREFYMQFDALVKEKNVLCLEESNTILRDIIDNSDAPFVYEKLGVRFEHFLLDEFQDTSNVQWDNFLPLLRESDSNGKFNMIVGDVKQSIYRWRDSEWKLLATHVFNDFPKAELVELRENRRSSRAVVDFNNRFFSYAAKSLDLQDIYGDVEQQIMAKEPQKGHVVVTFCDKEEELDKVLESICEVRDAGARLSDIAVLVRNHAEGGEVAAHLLAYDIPVISDDSLNIKTSAIVRRLVSVLHCIDNPDDTLSGYLATTLGLDIPSHSYSLVDLCEGLLREIRDLDPESFDGDTLFIQRFMDDLQSWVGSNGNNLKAYLQHFDSAKIFVYCPEDSDAVRIMTVHKAKGLEFPHVIFPFAEKVGFFKPDVHWCHLEVPKGTMDPVVNGIYPVTLSSKSSNSFFAESYEKERQMQLVDNINVFYVCLTRAGKSLHIISETPGNFKTPSKFTHILYNFCNENMQFEFGEPYDFYAMEREVVKDAPGIFPAVYESIPLNPKEGAKRLVPAADAQAFFAEEGVTSAVAPNVAGTILHSILEDVDLPGGIERAIARARSDGRIGSSTPEADLDMLRRAVASRPEWFSACGARTLNEVSVIGADGRESRPDRVVLRSGAVEIIDYKFGRPEPEHQAQVRRYMGLYRDLGYADVRGFVWYLREDRVQEID